MKCPKCGFEQAEGSGECLQCGIIFEKYLRRINSDAVEISPGDNQVSADQSGSRVKSSVRIPFTFSCRNDDAGNPFYFGGRVLVLLGIIILGAKFMFSSLEGLSSASTFLHLVNLPFHEAGHIFFRPMGEFMTSLGGTLGQLLMPLVCLAVFIIRTRDSFGAAVSLWWTGENFIDIAPYINDANLLVLPLLGGNTGSSSPYGFHDWEYILTEMGLVQHSHGIALSALIMGDIIMSAALLWGGYVLYRQYLHKRNS